MIEQYLVIAGSLILIVLGTIHLFYTFYSNKFSGRSEETDKLMKNDSPILTRETTMWRAWIGFNGSHSSGAMYIGLINILLASWYFEIYRTSIVLLMLNNLTLFFYLYLAKKYWFKIPLMGVATATMCFLISTIMIVS